MRAQRCGGPKICPTLFFKSFFWEEGALLEYLHAGPLQPCYATVFNNNNKKNKNDSNCNNDTGHWNCCLGNTTSILREKNPTPAILSGYNIQKTLRDLTGLNNRHSNHMLLLFSWKKILHDFPVLPSTNYTTSIKQLVQRSVRRVFICLINLNINIRKLSVASMCDQFLITCRPNFSVVWWLIVANFVVNLMIVVCIVIVWFRYKCLCLSGTIIKNLLTYLLT